jgi:hypothetical protein
MVAKPPATPEIKLNPAIAAAPTIINCFGLLLFLAQGVFSFSTESHDKSAWSGENGSDLELVEEGVQASVLPPGFQLQSGQ